MPLDALKAEQSKFFYLRGLLRQDYKDTRGALEDLRLAVELWPHRDNPAVAPLEDLASEAEDRARSRRCSRVRLRDPTMVSPAFRFLPAFLASAALAAAWTLFAGKDINWDLLNYHYYAPFQLLAGRLGRISSPPAHRATSTRWATCRSI